MTKIVLPHSGYKKLIVYKKSDVIYQGTVVFCRRFLPQYGDRTVDQMTQAARSCKQNIAEGSAAAGTSLETQIKLTNVARATLDELLEDYLDYLKSHNSAEWPMEGEKKSAARAFAKAHAEWDDWKPLFETRPAETICNLMIILIQQCRYLLDRMLKWQEEDFKKNGGVRERMHAARTEARGEAWDKAVYSMLALAKTPEELEARLSSIVDSARRAAWNIKNRNSWNVGVAKGQPPIGGVETMAMPQRDDMIEMLKRPAKWSAEAFGEGGYEVVPPEKEEEFRKKAEEESRRRRPEMYAATQYCRKSAKGRRGAVK